MNKILDNVQFKEFVQEIKQKIYSAKSKAILSANKLMIELYFEIGKSLVEQQDCYQTRDFRMG